MPVPRARIAAGLVAFLLLTGAFFVAGGAARALALEPDEYNVAGWVIRNFPAKWLYELGEPFRADRSVAQQDAELRRFFTLVDEIEALERDLEGAGRQRAGELDARRRERDRLENRVEDTLESRLTDVLESEGIVTSLGPLGEIVWPPVDFEFTEAPRSLAVSPRDRIQLIDTTLLRAGLSLEQVEAIEAQRERRGDVSALAFDTSGVGAYPTIVDYTDSYRGALETVAHEWLHNYLSFKPLGLRYYESNDLRTMNETVADLAGRELAALVQQRWPLEDAEEPELQLDRVEPPPRPPLDLRAELRQLRVEVDALLAEGRIEAAEALMEARRQDLAARGVRLRKLNQAYFAFTNLYAGEAGAPGAVNPIGPKIDELRRRAGSLERFLAIAEDLTSPTALDRALARLE